MPETIVLELPEDVLLNALRQLSPNRRRWLFKESEKEATIDVRFVPASTLNELNGVLSIGGDALNDSEQLYDY